MAMQDDHRSVALMPAAKLDAARAEARSGDLRADAVVGSGAVILARGAEVGDVGDELRGAHPDAVVDDA